MIQMTKELVIKILSGDVLGTKEQTDEAICMAIEALQAHPTLDDVSNAYENGYKQGKFEAQQWIPCSEVLPSENGDYLVTYRWIGTYSCEAYLEIGIDEWRKGEWVEKQTAYEVLAWMPLPSQYTEEEQ